MLFISALLLTSFIIIHSVIEFSKSAKRVKVRVKGRKRDHTDS